MLGKLSPVRKLSFRNKLLLSSMLLSIVPVLLLGFAASFVASSSIQNEVNAKHETTLRQIELQVDSMLRRLDYMSIQIAGDLTIEKSARLGISMDDLDALEATLGMVETFRKYRSISDFPFNAYLVYANSDKVYSNKYGLLAKQDFPFYDALRQYDPKFTGSLFIPSNSYPHQKEFLIVRPVGSSSTVDGILFLEVDPARFYELLQSVHIGGNSQLLAVNNEGRVVLSRQPNEIGTMLPAPFAERLGGKTPHSPNESVAYGNKRFQVSVHRSGYNDWMYVIIAPHELLTAQSSLIRYVTLMMAGSSAVLWGLLALFASNRLYNPIRVLLLKLPNRTKAAQDGLQQIGAFMQQVMETNRKLDSELREQLPHLRSSVLTKLLNGELNEAEFTASMHHFALPLRGPWFMTCVFEVDAFMEFKSSYLGKDRSLMMYALTKLVDEMAAQSYASASVASSLGQISLIIGTDDPDASFEQSVEELCGRIRLKAKELFRFTLTAGVSKPRLHVRSIHESHMEALELVSFRLLLGRDLTISRRASVSIDSVRQSARSLISRQKTIVKRISEGDLDAAHADFLLMVDDIPRHLPSFKPVTGIFTHLLGEIESLFERLGYDLLQLFPYNVYARLNEADSLEQLKTWFGRHFFPALRVHLERLTVPNQARIVRQVAEYVRSRAEEELSLQRAADQFGISQSQLSRMFKEEMGVNFVDYVIELRMSRAKEWLVHSDMPIKEIAERLQYTTAQNFSRAFKQTTGMSPGQYRDSVRHPETGLS